MIERTTDVPAKLLAAIAACVFTLFLGLSLTNWWENVEHKGFDVLTVATAPNASSLPITIIGIDEASFAQVGRQWPWPRGLYARLVDQVTKAGALVIAIDVLFPEAGNLEDQAFADAIYANGNVVLASDMAYQETAHARLWMRVDPLEIFKKAGAINGFAFVQHDGDLVVRQMPEGADVFWRQIIRKVNERQPGLLPNPNLDSDAMIRYAGPDHTFPYVSFYQALEADTHLPPNVFKDQIVLVGRDVKASPDARAGTPDVFATPFTAATRFLSPGVELHANILETAIRGDAIVPAPGEWSITMLAAVIALYALALRTWRPFWGALLLLVVLTAVGALDWYLFAKRNQWLPVMAVMLGVVSIYLSFGAVAYLAAQRRRGEMRRAFALYVSEEVVAHVMANPERLKLGGERREVTMLFTDLKGFTTMSEQLDPDAVGAILNEHFSRATAIIKRHNGTVNRFIGDAVMAMWGAPIEDKRQAIDAVLAACEMQDDMVKLREELRERGLPEIFMRVGLHSCTAVVGNLGSADRFDYTAIGDGVNLAARLEGVNKLYGTGILLSGETAAMLESSVPIRPVDRVIVKGKTEPVEIFTPCKDLAAIDFTREAVEAYRARRWDESEAAWREVLARLPGDGVAEIYLERIVRCRTLSPEAEWEAAVELEKL